MTETKLLTELEVEAWDVDEPPEDFSARVLAKLDADVPVVRIAPAPPSAAPRPWARISAAALGVAAAAGLVLWRSGPEDRTMSEDVRHDHAAARVADDDRAIESASQSGGPAERRRPSIAVEPTPETPETPETPKTPKTPKTSKTPKTPKTPKVPQVPQVPQAPQAPKAPASTEEPTSDDPPPPTPASDGATDVPTPKPPPVPEAPKAPPVPRSNPAPTAAMGLHVRSAASTRYHLQCKSGDAHISIVRNGDLDIGMVEREEGGLVLEDGELLLSTHSPIDCTIRRRRGDRIDVVLRTERGEARTSLAPPKRKIQFGI